MQTCKTLFQYCFKALEIVFRLILVAVRVIKTVAVVLKWIEHSIPDKFCIYFDGGPEIPADVHFWPLFTVSFVVFPRKL